MCWAAGSSTDVQDICAAAACHVMYYHKHILASSSYVVELLAGVGYLLSMPEVCVGASKSLPVCFQCRWCPHTKAPLPDLQWLFSRSCAILAPYHQLDCGGASGP